jgi:hypothetical protein
MGQDRISAYLGGLNLTPVRLSMAGRAELVKSLKERLQVNVEAVAPWDSVNAPVGVKKDNGWELIPQYIGNESCLVWSSGAEVIWRFSNGNELLEFLREVPPFEYYVCDEAATFLLCSNHHNFVIGWGSALSWVKDEL